MIGLHCTVQWEMTCKCSSPEPSLFSVEVGLACETNAQCVEKECLYSLVCGVYFNRKGGTGGGGCGVVHMAAARLVGQFLPWLHK